MLLRGDLLFLRRQTKKEPKAFIQRLEGTSVWLGCGKDCWTASRPW